MNDIWRQKWQQVVEEASATAGDLDTPIHSVEVDDTVIVAIDTDLERAEAEVKRLKVLIAWRDGICWDLPTVNWPTVVKLVGATVSAEIGGLWRTAVDEGLALVREEAERES